MNIFEWMERFQRLNELINNGEATSIEVIGKKMSITPSEVRYLMKVMKRNGAPLIYDRKLKRFLYQKTGSFRAEIKYVFPDAKLEASGNS